METLKLTDEWLVDLLPDGWPICTSTLLTGPGGSGKPLIGNVVAATWLREGGSVVFMPLQYPDPEFITSGLKKMTGVDVADHAGRVAYLELDVTLKGFAEPVDNRIRANLLLPEVWETSIERACGLVSDTGPGVLVMGSALNLLLFSPTYGHAILDRMRQTIQDDKRRTYLFSVSSSAKADMIEHLEEAADNLIVSHSTQQPFRLHLHIERMQGVTFHKTEVMMPVDAETLEEIRTIADYSRKRVIPLVSSI